MDYISHSHSVVVPRGGKVITGDNDYNGENTVIDTPEYDRRQLTPRYESTGKVGVIQPCLNFHVNAGDSFKISANMFQRFQPLVATPFTAIETTLHSFYVPFRMLDYGFDQFMTGGKDGDYNIPQLHARFFVPCLSDQVAAAKDWNLLNSLWGHNTDDSQADDTPTPLFNGKPLGGIGSLLEDFGYGYQSSKIAATGQPANTHAPQSPVNIYPLLAYQRIYNDFYRVPELEPDLFIHNHRQSLETYARSLRSYISHNHAAPLSAEGDPDIAVIDIERVVLEWLQSSDCEGFLGFMQHLLTDPLLHNTLQGYIHSDTVWVNHSSAHNVLLSSNYSAFVNSDNQLDAYSALVYYDDTDGVWYLAEGYYEEVEIPDEEEVQTVLHEMSDLDLCAFFFMIAVTVCKNAPYERDRFTSTLPYLQRGEYVSLVKKDIITGVTTTGAKSLTVDKDSVFENGLIQSYYHANVGNGQYLATNITVDDLRQLNATAKFLEKNARVGYRFEEYIRGIFGIDVKGDDHMLKPTYIGGLKQYVNLDIVTSPVATDRSLQAQQASNMTMNGNGSVGDFSVPEPGIILAFLITKPRTTYINCVDRNNYKFADRTLFYTPDFAHLPEQPIWSPEINDEYEALTGVHLSDLINGKGNYTALQLQKVFGGYEPRFNEYRTILDHIGGELCSTQIYNTTARQDLDMLNNPDDTFHNDYYWQHVMYDDPSVTRIFNYNDNVTDQFQFALSWSISQVSLVPNYANPKL